ncbi:MVD1 decarboxylase, partial [Crypturellus undulatus]|nr:MVD1 decarboxylase [Crypturellus undulatus]
GTMAEEEEAVTLVTCTAPVNMAVIKYWGKRDTELILPLNSSLSVTLHQEQLRTTTTVAASRAFAEDRLWLNGEEADAGHPRLQACLREVRRLARKRRGGDGEDAAPLSYKVHVASENNFPTAAGLASVLGGFVQWHRGEREDGEDSVARQVAPETHWPELRALVIVVSADKKPVGSTAGMQTSVETSALLKHRAEVLVPERVALMARHIRERDFEAFGELTMRDSNQFHATCLDTFPPIFYLNDVSRRIIALAHRYNAHHGRTKVAYTFDAGPNAVVFALADTVDEFVEVLRRCFPPAHNGDRFLQGLPVGPAVLPPELLSAVLLEPMPGAIRSILHTKPGPGPQVLDDPSQHLLGPDGLPRGHQ